MSEPFETRRIGEQPVVFVRRRVSMRNIGEELGQMLGATFAYCTQAAIALAGMPFCRYTDFGDDDAMIEAGLVIASVAEGGGDVRSGALPGGRVAVALHEGNYTTLHETHAKLHAWAGEKGFIARDAIWESYLTDPGEHPNPADWRTEVILPIED